MRYSIPDRIAWLDARDFVEWDDGLYLMVLPDGDPIVLRDTAAQIWLLATTGEDVVAEMAAITGEDPAGIAGEIEAFAQALVEYGLLRREDPS